jgi:hypothetical protein
MLEPRQRSAFRLGDVISGEPQLYCGYAARPLMPRTIALATLLAASLAIRLYRRAAATARALFGPARPPHDAAIATLAPGPVVPARHHAAADQRRAA